MLAKPAAVDPLVGPSDAPTASQRDLFCYFFGQTLANGYQPSYRDAMTHFGWSSTNAVTEKIRRLSRKGWVAMPDAVSRCVRFLRNPDGSPFRGFDVKV